MRGALNVQCSTCSWEQGVAMRMIDFALGDRVRLRKPHPCGSYDWQVVRLGADIGLKCEGCGRRVLLPRSEAEKRVKSILSRGTVVPPEQE